VGAYHFAQLGIAVTCQVVCFRARHGTRPAGWQSYRRVGACSTAVVVVQRSHVLFRMLGCLVVQLLNSTPCRVTIQFM
jgi:hypothetical protein